MKEQFLKYFYVSLFLFSVIFISGCRDSDLVETYTTFTGKMMGQYLSEEDSTFSEFTAALNRAGALSLLNTYGKYTCFAPTNEAMQQFYAEKGKTLEQLDSTELRDLVFYHLIDGETAGTQYYRTTDYDVFGKGALPTKNMAGRYIYISLSNSQWMIDKTARIISADNEMINGVVHVINKVLQGNKDLLPDFIAANSRYSLFSKALEETRLADSLKLVDDESYVQKPNWQYVRATYNKSCPYPKSKLYGFTVFMESDSIMKLNNINTFDELVNYAKSVYDVMYPDDKNITNFADRRNSLNRFVAYHIVNKKMTSDKIVVKWAYTYTWSTEYSATGWFSYKNDDDKYLIEQYLIPMCPNTLIAVQLGNYFNFYDKQTDQAGSVLSSSYRGLMTEARKRNFITLIDTESNNECLNGIYHSLNNMLVYDQNVESKVLKKRLRMEVRTFMPELDNNDFNFEKYSLGPMIIPDNYCKALTYNEESKVKVILFPANVHPYMYGDEMLADGFFNLKLKVGPIPAGKYEVRVGYQVRPTTRGITQYYFDGRPCGIPIDQKKTGTDPEIGWQQVYNDALIAGRTAADPVNDADPDGFENDKLLRNRGYMRGPDIWTGPVFRNDWQVTNYSARNSTASLRRILGIFSFDETSTHELGMVQMSDGDALLDYIEFMPVEMIPEEDTH